MDTLYERIKQLCESRSITGYRMSDDIGISKSILTDLKSGRKKGLSAEVANKIANYFDVTVDFLLTGESPTNEKTPQSEDQGDL